MVPPTSSSTIETNTSNSNTDTKSSNSNSVGNPKTLITSSTSSENATITTSSLNIIAVLFSSMVLIAKPRKN
jgi:heme-binding NEAT domain protein